MTIPAMYPKRRATTLLVQTRQDYWCGVLEALWQRHVVLEDLSLGIVKGERGEITAYPDANRPIAQGLTTRRLLRRVRRHGGD